MSEAAETLIAGQTEASPQAQPSAATTEGTAPAPAGQQQAPQPAAPPAPAVAAQPPAADPAKPAGPPAEYAEFTVPEGMTLVPEVAEGVKAVAKDLGLTQEQAQKLADANMNTAQAVFVKARSDWETQSRNDPEVGGAAFAESIGYANKAVDAFGSAEFKALLNRSGLGNHPEMLRVFSKVGRAISEDRLVTGATGHPGGERDARSLYGKSNMNP